MSSRDLIPRFAKGKIIKATALEQLRIAATQQVGGNGAFVDSTGTYQRRQTQRERGIWFKPDTDVPAHGVMYSTGIDSTQGELVIETKKPDGLALGEIILINGPEDVDSGVYGKCHMAGDVPVKALVNSSETLAAGDVCGPKSSQWDLYEEYPGLIAFDVEDSNDLAWVQSYKHHHFWGVLDGPLSQGNSATCRLWWGSTLADSTEDVTVHDNLLASGESIASGGIVEIEYFPIGKKFYVLAAHCDDISDI